MHWARAVLAIVWLGLTTARVAHAQLAPVIEHLEPSAGPVGTRLQIVGRGFIAGASVQLGDVELIVEQVSPSRIVSRVTPEAVSGVVRVRTSVGEARGPQFRVTEVTAAPHITSFSPSAGPPGTELTIFGSGFASGLSRTRVALGDQPLVVRSATPTQLVVIVSDAAQSAPISVRTLESDEVISSASFQVTARTEITSFEPAGVAAGGSVKVVGTGFSSVAADNRVFINNQRCLVQSASPTELQIQVPARATTGALVLDVRGGGRAQSSRNLVVQRVPVLSSMSPSKGLVGALVTLRGAHFGNDASVIEARLGDVALPVRQALDSHVVVEIPVGAQSGSFSIAVHGVGPSTLAEAFEVLEPLALQRFEPTSAAIGSVLKIEGAGFSPTPAANRVQIAGRALDVLKATSRQLTVRVTPGSSGPIEISVAGSGSVRSVDPFVVITPPIVSSYSPQRATVGSEITLIGLRFGQDARAITVTLQGQPQQIVSVRDDVLAIRLVAGARSGRLTVTAALQGSTVVEPALVVLPTLAVLRVWPDNVAVGTTVDVRGSGFEAGAVIVLGEQTLEPESITPERIRFVVPTDATGGLLTVQLRDGRAATAARHITIAR